MPDEIQFTVNGAPQTVQTDRERPLLDVLREDLGLTGSKYGCGEGECGACTVLIDGIPTRSCITSIGECAGQSVKTIEAISQGGALHPIQQAFLDCHAMQCGYCVPGHIMTAMALVAENPSASDDEIVATMSEHLCRCCNYENIKAAVKRVVSGA